MKLKHDLSDKIEQLVPSILHAMSLERVKTYIVGILLIGIGFFVLPFTDWGKEAPWYYWVGFGTLTLVVGTVLMFCLSAPRKNMRHSNIKKRVRKLDNFE